MAINKLGLKNIKIRFNSSEEFDVFAVQKERAKRMANLYIKSLDFIRSTGGIPPSPGAKP
jgi:hypothetical protein